MFWGLIMEPQRRYSQKVKKSFHVSMAALDISTSTDNEPTQVICSFDNRNYLMCTLQKDKVIQVPLDLNFEVDDTVCFATNGKANIHLTGYLTEEFCDLDDTGDLNDTIDSNDTSDSDDTEETEKKPVETASRKKRQSVQNNSSPPKKKSKTLELLAAVDSQKEDTDSDDSDYDLSLALNEEGSDEEMDTTQLDEEEDGEEEEEEKEEDDEDEAEEEESENEDGESDEDEEEASSLSDNEEVEKPKTAKINGVPKKEQKQKQAKNEVPEIVVPQKEKKSKTPKSEKAQQQQQKGEKTPKDENKTSGKASKLSKDESKTPSQTAKSPAESPVQKRTLEGGVLIEDLKLGNGPAAKTGRVVQVYYEGRFKNNKKMFDSTTKGPGFKFRLGRQEVIKGWDVGVVGMKVGGKRRITCPPNMAYGQKGSPPAIPPNSTLVFEIELKNVN